MVRRKLRRFSKVLLNEQMLYSTWTAKRPLKCSEGYLYFSISEIGGSNPSFGIENVWIQPSGNVNGEVEVAQLGGKIQPSIRLNGTSVNMKVTLILRGLR